MNYENDDISCNKIEVRPALEDDLDAVKELADKIFGIGYLSDEFSQDMKLEDSICLVATSNGDIIGMIYFNKVNAHRANSRFLKCVMVDERYRRKGIGLSLYQKALKMLTFEERINDLHASCWKESPRSGIIPFLQKKGWEISSSVERYWYRESVELGYQCDRCGNPCFCTAVLMSINLPNSFTVNSH